MLVRVYTCKRPYCWKSHVAAHMLTYLVGLEVFILARDFIYTHTLCMRAATALASLL